MRYPPIAVIGLTCHTTGDLVVKSMTNAGAFDVLPKERALDLYESCKELWLVLRSLRAARHLHIHRQPALRLGAESVHFPRQRIRGSATPC